VAAFVSDAVGAGWTVEACFRRSRRRRDGDLGHFGLKQIAAARNDPDHLALVVAERGADFADALEQAVLADMDVRPGGLPSTAACSDAAGIPGEQPQYLQRLGPEPDRPAIGGTQLGALGIELKARKAQHRSSPAGNCPILSPDRPQKCT
jgi:hypothetical protein